eukprot:9472402-Pyramimonas_sp.AAC.1
MGGMGSGSAGSGLGTDVPVRCGWLPNRHCRTDVITAYVRLTFPAFLHMIVRTLFPWCFGKKNSNFNFEIAQDALQRAPRRPKRAPRRLNKPSRRSSM